MSEPRSGRFDKVLRTYEIARLSIRKNVQQRQPGLELLRQGNGKDGRRRVFCSKARGVYNARILAVIDRFAPGF
jgi:hypothetical protein